MITLKVDPLFATKNQLEHAYRVFRSEGDTWTNYWLVAYLKTDGALNKKSGVEISLVWQIAYCVSANESEWCWHRHWKGSNRGEPAEFYERDDAARYFIKGCLTSDGVKLSTFLTDLKKC